ncbi:MAG: tRNA pseudouridine(38-40) synthase TruA [Clostridiales bacterium]|jgi:tRNA pseudouridine38-40 synthase|nr:tRNA pseudouridine(38-40) synthase TruA [Clostridiales bacterium]
MQILLDVAYDGTAYCGWQWQKNGVSVQETLEEGIKRALGLEVLRVAGASRTDAGVHALGQRASFFAQGIKIPLDKLPLVISSYLPKDICVFKAQEVPDDFSPRFNAKEKTYLYRYLVGSYPNPLLRHMTVFCPHELDVGKMGEAARLLEGEHDFAAFCAAGSSAKTTVRTVYECSVSESEGIVSIKVRGNGFLYNMVRIIAGTLWQVGLGKNPPESAAIALESRKREQAGKTAPAKGLCLVDIKY